MTLDSLWISIYSWGMRLRDKKRKEAIVNATVMTAVRECPLSRLVALLLASMVLPTFAQRSYSPPVGNAFPTSVYWGDTHVHTHLSWDAYGSGNRLTPDDANRFAKGETVIANNGQEVSLRRPLDFLMVADHSQNFGVLPHMAAGNPLLLEKEASKPLVRLLRTIPGTVREALNAPTDKSIKALGKHSGAIKQLWSTYDYGADQRFMREVWDDVIATAERHNDPGKFTSFIGYEWSPRLIHRNVIFQDDAARTREVLPYSSFDSINPEDLWTNLRDYEDRTGGRVISVPHNANLGGDMFRLTTFHGQPLTREYAQLRSRFEPLTEVTQIKGDSETHPLVSPTDAFADYETWPVNDKNPTREQKAVSYARPALMNGLDLGINLGTNPFKFGMIGSTDAHTSLATADEDNFWGKMAVNEPSPYRMSAWFYSAAGYAAVWAHENTRASLFDAMQRKETYATTGPRITVRFFGGWAFTDDDALRPDLGQVGYTRGVPMGGDLVAAPNGRAPSFLIRAVRDPDGANLDRVQIIKGWRDATGALFEKVHDVALSDDREMDRQGNVAPLGNTVNLTDPSYNNSIGDPELAVVWTDPDFEPDEAAFYYVRVLEIPTPRWTAYDAVHYGLKDLPKAIPMVTQERAYSSPIWYTP